MDLDTGSLDRTIERSIAVPGSHVRITKNRRRLASPPYAKGIQERMHVMLYGRHRNSHLQCDFFVREALIDEAQHASLGGRYVIEIAGRRAWAGAHAVHGAVHRGHDVMHAPVLHAARAVGITSAKCSDFGLFVQEGHDEIRSCGNPHAHQDDIGLEVLHERNHMRGVGRGRQHGDVATLVEGVEQ